MLILSILAKVLSPYSPNTDGYTPSIPVKQISLLNKRIIINRIIGKLYSGTTENPVIHSLFIL